MNITRLRCLLFFSVSAMSAAVMQAQTAPPLKPGLWEIHMEHEVNGQKMPDMSEHMKNLSPEARQQVEAMMKQRGMEMGGGGTTKVCYSKETLDQGRWADVKSGCKTDYTTRTAASWKWHSSCPQYNMESDGEATFSSPESYVMKATTVSKGTDKARNSQMTMTGKWLSADCGDVKPLQAKP